MKYYFAPMEGITGYIYRRSHQRVFPGIDKYFTPFLVPDSNTVFNQREKNEILPEHNERMNTVPQILTNRAEDFVRAAKTLEQYGYREINLNLGCPSGTVTAKKRGSGFLTVPDELDNFFEQVFRQVSIHISVKTRIGYSSIEEFGRLLEIYNRYPIYELIIHPRLRQDFYKYPPHMEVFEATLKESKNPVCYNGDLFHSMDCEKFKTKFPQIERIMLGRGFLINPGLVKKLKGGEDAKKTEIEKFHAFVYEGYREIMSGDRNVLFKMKELWSYLIQSFTENKKYAKSIRKAANCYEYDIAVKSLFRKQELLSEVNSK